MKLLKTSRCAAPWLLALCIAAPLPWAHADESTASPVATDTPAVEAPAAEAPPPKKKPNVRAMFGNNCGRCHENFGLHAGPGPKLAGIKLTREQIIQTITKGRGAMPSFGKTLKPEQIELYADYIQELKDPETGG